MTEQQAPLYFSFFSHHQNNFFLKVVYSVAVGGRQKLCVRDSTEQLKLHFMRSAIGAEGIWNVPFFTPPSPPPFSVWLYFWTTCSDWDYFISSDRQCGFHAQYSLISWRKLVEYIFFWHHKLWIIHDYLTESNRKADTRCSSSNQELFLELSSKIRLTVTELSLDVLRLYQSNEAPLLKPGRAARVLLYLP